MNRKDFIIALCCAFFSLIVYAPFVFIGTDFTDQGVLMATTYALNRNAVLYRDIFSQYGPLTSFIHVLGFKLFGESLFSLQLMTLLFYPLISFFLYICTRYFLSKIEGLTVIFIWISSAYFFFYPTAMPWSSVYSLAFILIAFFFSYRTIQNHKTNFLYSGLFISLAFWAKQSVGIPFLSVSILFLLLYAIGGDRKQRKKYLLDIVYILIGFIIPSLFFVFYFATQSALLDMWTDMFVFAYTWGRHFGNDLNVITILKCLFPPSLYSFIRTTLIIFSVSFLVLKSIKNDTFSSFKIFLAAFVCVGSALLLQPLMRIYLDIIKGDPIIPLGLAFSNIIGVCIFFYQMVKNRRLFLKKQISFIFLLFMSLAAWIQYFPISEPLHIFYSIPIMIIFTSLQLKFLINYIIQKFHIQTSSQPPVSTLFFLLIMLAFWLPGGIPRLSNAFIKLVSIRHLVSLHTPPNLNGILETPQKAAAIGKLAGVLDEIIKTNPKKNVQLIGIEPMVLTFIPNNHIQKLFLDYGDFTEKYFPKNRTDRDIQIMKNKPIIIVTKPFFEISDRFAQEFHYKIIYRDSILKHAVLIPNEDVAKDF